MPPEKLKHRTEILKQFLPPAANATFTPPPSLPHLHLHHMYMLVVFTLFHMWFHSFQRQLKCIHLCHVNMSLHHVVLRYFSRFFPPEDDFKDVAKTAARLLSSTSALSTIGSSPASRRRVSQQFPFHS